MAAIADMDIFDKMDSTKVGGIIPCEILILTLIR